MVINSDLICRNNDNLLLFLNNNLTILKRLKKELDILYELFDYVEVSKSFDGIVLKSGKKEILKIIVYETINQNKYKYEFIINNNYPFVSPNIFYQNYPYSDYLRPKYNKKHFKIFNKITNKNCLCCASYICSLNWTPATTLNNIIKEIHQVRKDRRNVLNKIFADIIKTKYLIDDIDLDGWLF